MNQSLRQNTNSKFTSRTSQCHNIIKTVQNTNKQISKRIQENQRSAILNVQTILGFNFFKQQYQNSQPNSNMIKNSQKVPLNTFNNGFTKFQQNKEQQFLKYQTNDCFKKSHNKNEQSQEDDFKSPMIQLNEEQILYYSCRYFIIYNISTKQYQVINKDIKNYHLKDMKRFNLNENDKKLILCVYQGGDKKQSNQHNQEKQQNQTNDSTIFALLTIKTDYESRSSRSDSRYEMKMIKLFNYHVKIQDYKYYDRKNYIYLITSKKIIPKGILAMKNCTNSTGNQNRQQNFIIFDLKKQLFLINQQIKSSTVGYFIKKVIIQNQNMIYLLGHNYFRQWTVNFNQKSIKQSNVRNVQRMIKNKQIIDVVEIEKYSINQSNCYKNQMNNLVLNQSTNQRISYDTESVVAAGKNNRPLSSNNLIGKKANQHQNQNNIHQQCTTQTLTQPSKLLFLLTQRQLILIKNNQYICSLTPQVNQSKTTKNHDNIQKQLQNSFNQIYKMKFIFEQQDDEMQEQQQNSTITINQQSRKKKQTNQHQQQHHQNQHKQNNIDVKFQCISKCWKVQDKIYYFAIATNKSDVQVYELQDLHLKMVAEYNCNPVNSQLNYNYLKTILTFLDGDLLILLNQNKQIFLINQQNYENSQQKPEQGIKSLWGNGQLHTDQIYSLDSPMIQNVMCTVGSDNTIKLWSLKNQRVILFEEKSKLKPLGLAMHPCGTMLAVNFQKQIKLLSILPKEFYEITSIKTNYPSSQLKYSKRGQFLVSNQGSIILFYEPFSLKTIGYIQPSDVKSKIIDFQVSSNSQYICFLTEDNNTYFHGIQIGDLSRWVHIESSHTQKQPYTCYYFDFYCKSSLQTNSNTTNHHSPNLTSTGNSFISPQHHAITNNNNNPANKSEKNLFIGCCRNKYMVIYENYGKSLLVEFPIIDCYIVDIQVHENLMFAATSKGTVRVYKWPILEQDLELQIYNYEQKKIRYKAPSFDEYPIWNQKIPIQKIHKLRFCNELIVVNTCGNMAIVPYKQTKNHKTIYQQISVERKKMQQLINQIFYIKKSETERRNKLIQKTQNDILKVENEIVREKIVLEKKLMEEENSIGKTYLLKQSMQKDQKQQYINKQSQQIRKYKQQINLKRNNLQRMKQQITSDYQNKKLYERNRNGKLADDINKIILEHKRRINRKIQTHKEDIYNLKRIYQQKIKSVQDTFNLQVEREYRDVLENNVNKDDDGNKTFVIKSMQKQFNDELMQQLKSKQNQQIIVQQLRLQQICECNQRLSRQIDNLKTKVQTMQTEDERLQKQFQKNLQDYNRMRFENLTFHSEVLKMQNQLIERKEILTNKQEIVMLAYQEKQKLQNYKELVKGELSTLQKQKQGNLETLYRKQNDLNTIFNEWMNQIHKMQEKKSAIQKMQYKLQISQKQQKSSDEKVKECVDRLKQIKRFLLLERINDQKYNYQNEEQLLNTINFLKKRLFMQSIKDKKNKQLKKSSLNQILKQNKNMLEECNQLRSEAIDFDKEIKNLSNKLREANQMISIENKLKSQKSHINQQKQHLNIIRELFKGHLNQLNQGVTGQEQNQLTFDNELMKCEYEKIIKEDSLNSSENNSFQNLEYKQFKHYGDGIKR